MVKPKKIKAYACAADDCLFISQSENKTDMHTREQHVPTYFETDGYKCSKCGNIYDDDMEAAERCCKNV